MIGANDQLLSADDYRSLVVAYRGGAPVRVMDVADVVDGFARPQRVVAAPAGGADAVESKALSAL